MSAEPGHRTRRERLPGALVLALGVPAGLVFGVAARAWMRLVSSDPEFTWSGSIFVVSLFAAALGAQAVAVVVGRRPSPIRRVVAGTVSWSGVLLLGFGPGAVVLPFVATAPVAAGPTRRPLTRVVAGVVAGANLVAMFAFLDDDLGWARVVTGWVVMIALYGGFVAARVAVRRTLWTGASAVRLWQTVAVSTASVAGLALVAGLLVGA